MLKFNGHATMHGQRQLYIGSGGGVKCSRAGTSNTQCHGLRIYGLVCDTITESDMYSNHLNSERVTVTVTYLSHAVWPLYNDELQHIDLNQNRGVCR